MYNCTRYIKIISLSSNIISFVNLSSRINTLSLTAVFSKINYLKVEIGEHPTLLLPSVIGK